MENSEITAFLEKAREEFESTDAPPIYWTSILVGANSFCSIAPPQPGNLWINYKYDSSPPASISIQHSNNNRTTIVPGENTYPIVSGDLINITQCDDTNSIVALFYYFVS